MKKYPVWVDEYTKSAHNAFTNMSPASWGPIDAIDLMSGLNGTFIAKVHDAGVRIKQKPVPIKDVAESFSCPSTLRVALYFLMLEYTFSEPKNKEQFKEVIEFLVDVIKTLVRTDLFAYKSNVRHSDEEINNLLDNTPWQKASPSIAREIGKLYTSAASLVFALYRDFFPQDSHEVYGAYDASRKFGKNTILIIKHFPKVKPTEIWQQASNFKYSDIKIFQVYKNVKFSCEFIGMHSLYKGDLMKGLVAYAVMVDGKYVNSVEEIKKITNYLAQIATENATIADKLSEQDVKKKVLEWECYQFFNFFKLAHIDWKPTPQMLKIVKDKKVAKRFESEQFASYDEYVSNKNFEIYWLRDLYA